MAEAVKSITASTYSATTGQNIRYIGRHCYAYSGVVAFALVDTPSTALKFTTGAGYIDALFYVDYLGTSGDDMLAILYLNNQIVFQSIWAAGQSPDYPTLLKIIIPPSTIFKLTVENNSDNTAHTATAVLTGRVYGVE